MFRPAPVAVDDPSLRTSGTSGPVLVPPGSLSWFRAAAQVRAGEEGLASRLVPTARGAPGWDPAGSYRSFEEMIERKELAGAARRSAAPQEGELRPEGATGPAASGTEAATPGPSPSGAGPHESGSS